jgi:hypothetical protein
VRAALLAVIAVVSAAAVPDAVAAPADPPCFGAAVRAAVHPCHDRRLRFMVRPRPSVAQITPNEPCEFVPPSGPVHPCAFGVRPREARARIALVGDSHASHLRAALVHAARAKRWYGLSVTSSVCPISRTRQVLPPADARRCNRWNRAVPRWLRRHPAIGTVFQSQIVSPRDVYRGPGETRFSAQVRGYLQVWETFPRSVRRIVVIRDDPRTSVYTPDCVMRARAQHRRPGYACAEPRAWALPPDPLAEAARRARGRRVDLIDLTRFMCSRTRCFPVVGGALVHKDVTHLTRAFARTLGPFLLRRLG